MRTLRSYRLLPALLALSLVLTAAMPLVAHACDVTAAEMATMPCCKGKAGHHDAPARSMHGAMTSNATADGAMPCHEAPEAPAPCPDDGSTVQAACCFTADAPAAPLPERLQVSPTALVALVTAFVLPPPSPAASPTLPLADTSPPAPVALHLLYGTFLT